MNYSSYVTAELDVDILKVFNYYKETMMLEQSLNMIDILFNKHQIVNKIYKQTVKNKMINNNI